MKLIIIILLLLLSLIFNLNNAEELLLKKGDIRLHIIAHSHQDSGWTSTMDEYYSRQVKSILTTMVQALDVEVIPPRKFVISEIGFLEKWWDDMPNELQEDFKKHVKNDRIEFVNGGWVMNDEACASTESVIRHLSNGHKFIKEKFGKQPENGWQIDPFGHSSVTPSIQAQMGYKHIVLNRIHYELKNKFRNEKNLQFRWRGSPEGLGPKSDMLAHVFDDFYTGPPHFNFDGYNFMAYGVDRLVKELIELANNRSVFYKSPHVLIPIGGDFAYKNAIRAMEQMDEIFKGVNEKYKQGHSNVQVQYSTLADFFGDTVQWHKKNNVEFNYYDGDFFPYADDAYNYWTGYYTSRPLLKGYERYVSSKLRSAEIYSAWQNDNSFTNAPLLQASKQVSILQHHDAISGTSKVHVVQDYTKRLDEADSLTSQSAEKSLANAMSPGSPTILTTIDIGESIKFPQSSNFVSFILTNQLSWRKEELVTFKVEGGGAGGDHCPYVLAVDKIDNEIEIDCSPRTGFKNEKSDEHNEFIQIDFPAILNPFSTKQYFLKRKVDSSKSNWITPILTHVKSIENTMFKANLDENYFLKSIQSFHDNNNNGEILPINQQLLTYTDLGGAYVFRTNKKVFEPPRQLYSTFTYIGKFYEEAQSVLQDEHEVSPRYGYYYYNGYNNNYNNNNNKQKYNTFNFNTIKLLKTGNTMIDKKINFNFHIKGINGTTTINRFNTNLINNLEIYTDNGLEMMHRKPLHPNEPLIGRETESYYPTINIAYIESINNGGGGGGGGKRFICNNDRSRGVSSQKQGSIEFALHRSLTYEDGKGLEIPAIDEATINARMECYFGDLETDDIRKQSINYQHKFQIFQGQDSSKMQSIQFLSSKSLPEFIHIQTMERSSRHSIKLRIQNINNLGTNPIRFDLNGLFSFINSIKSIKEYNLSLVNPYVDNNIDDIITNSYQSIVDNNLFPIKNHPHRFTPIDSQSTEITISPSEIKSIEIFYN